MRSIYAGDFNLIWEEAQAAVALRAKKAEENLARKPSKRVLSRVASARKDPTVFDDVGLSLKVLLFANRLQLKRLQKAASGRLQSLLAADNLVRVFKGALAAADMALCSECLNYITEELPEGESVEDRMERERKEAAAAGMRRTPKGKGAPGKGSPAARKPKPRASGGAGAGAGAGARTTGAGAAAADAEADVPPPPGEVLEKEVRDVTELLKTFIVRVLSA